MNVKISCVKYFNGFSLRGEEALFSEYLIDSDLCIAGFSYGAQKAFDHVYSTAQRVERLILLSPAFFQTQKESFVRTQLHYFEAGNEAYVETFLKNAASPSSLDLSAYLKTGTKEELEALLQYKWDPRKIHDVVSRGTTVEVFLGQEDKIIALEDAYDFFAEHCTVYLMKETGHILQY